MLTYPHIDSYYAATAQASPAPNALAGSIDCDVCVVGGGITGCSTALHLAERGYQVVLLEANRVGWGASGRSGAQVIFGYARDMDYVERLVGKTSARQLWDLSLEGMQLVKDRIASHGIDCEWQYGQMHVGIKSRHHTELKRYQEFLARDYNYALQFIERPALQDWLASPRYCAGLYDPRGGHVHSLNYTLGLARAARTAGARIFEHSQVINCDLANARVHTANGVVNARYLVFAGNAYLDRLVPELSNKIMPVGTYIVATQPLGRERAQQLIPNRMAVTDINFVLDYYRLSGDDRLLFGGRVSYSKIPPPNLKATMLARVLRVFPQLADVDIDYCWSGFVDISYTRLPHIGRLAKNVFFAQGYSGHGMALTGLTGKIIAETIAGTAECFDVFTRIPQRNFPGGRLFRVPGVLLGTFYYRMRDLL